MLTNDGMPFLSLFFLFSSSIGYPFLALFDRFIELCISCLSNPYIFCSTFSSLGPEEKESMPSTTPLYFLHVRLLVTENIVCDKVGELYGAVSLYLSFKLVVFLFSFQVLLQFIAQRIVTRYQSCSPQPSLSP